MSSIASARSFTRPFDFVGVRAFVVGFSATLLVAILVAVAASFAIGIANEGHVLSGVKVGGIALGGLDRDAAAAKLRAEMPQLSD